MDFKRLFFAYVFVFGIGLAFFLWVSNLNTNYASFGAQTVDTGFYSTVSSIETDAGTINGAAVQSVEETGISSSGTDSALSQSRSVFGVLFDMVSFVPDKFVYASQIFGLDARFAQIAGWIFTVAFIVTIAYLLIVGVTGD